MARWSRLTVPGIPLHVTQRGNNRVPIFLDDLDRGQFREYLRHACAAEGCGIHAYALMTNHVHLLVTPSTVSSASRMMQIVGRRYVRYFNARHQRSGTLWEGRFKSALVDTSAYFLTCSRYIDLNPVRAGLVTAPHEFEWSSYLCLGYARNDPLLTLHPEYLQLGHTTTQRCAAYRTHCGEETPLHRYDSIRRATRGGCALGEGEFQSRMSQLLRRPVTRASRGGNRVHRVHPAPMAGRAAV
jgi:putative transposase